MRLEYPTDGRSEAPEAQPEEEVEMAQGTVESNQITRNEQLPLLAQVGTRLGARWRRVGVVTRLDGELQARFDCGAELFEEVWSTRHGRSAPKTASRPAVRFAVTDGEEFVRIVAVCPLTPALCATLRHLSKLSAGQTARRGSRSGSLAGGPRGLHSRWPVG